MRGIQGDRGGPQSAASTTNVDSVAIAGDVVDSVIITGDNNRVIRTLVVGNDAGAVELVCQFEHLGERSYIVTARVPDADRVVTSQIELPYPRPQLLEPLTAALHSLDGAAQTYGEQLWTALFSPSIQELYDECAQRQLPVRLRLQLTGAALHALPWETMFDPGRRVWLGQIGTVVRELPPRDEAAVRQGPVAGMAPLRVLTLDLQPESGPGSPIEGHQLDRALDDVELTGRIQVECMRPASPEEVEGALIRAAGEGGALDVLHVLGALRASVDGEPEPSAQRPAPSLDLAELIRLARTFQVQVLVYSPPPGSPASALELLTAAQGLLQSSGLAGVVVLPLTGQTREDTQTFRGFYTSLCAGEPLDKGAWDAVRRRSSSSSPSAPLQGVPVCLIAPGTVLQFALEAPLPPSLTRATWRAWLRQRSTAVPLILGSVLVAALGISTLLERLTPPPLPLMKGSVNVAVVPFSTVDDRGDIVEWSVGAALAGHVAESLASRREAILGLTAEVSQRLVAVHGPDKTRALTARVASERERQAQALAGEIGADVIVSGLAMEGGRRFIPELYLSDRLNQGALDPGFYAFGEVTPEASLLTDIVEQTELSTRLLPHATGITHLALGLNAYLNRRYGLAITHFDAAERSATPTRALEAQDGLEALNLLIGDTLLKHAFSDQSTDYAGRLEVAQQARARYQRALEINGEFASAWIGLAEVAYLTSMGSACSAADSQFSAEGLDQAMRLYEHAGQAARQPRRIIIPAQVQFGLGRTKLCLALSGTRGESPGEIRRHLQAVIQTYQGGNVLVKDWATESHFMLGLMALRDARTAPESLVTAAEAFASAIELSYDQDEQARAGERYRLIRYCSMLGAAHRLRGHTPAPQELPPAVSRDVDCGAHFHAALAGKTAMRSGADEVGPA